MGIYCCEKTPSLELLKSSFCPVKNLLAIRKTPDFPGKRVFKRIIHEISHFKNEKYLGDIWRVLRQLWMPQGTEPPRERSSEPNSCCWCAEQWEAAVSPVPVFRTGVWKLWQEFQQPNPAVSMVCLSQAAPQLSLHFWSSQLSDPLGCDPAQCHKQHINYISRKMHLNIEVKTTITPS